MQTKLQNVKSKRKQSDGEIKFNLSCKRLSLTESVKYLGVKIDGSLTWKFHIDYLSVNLNRANGLFKIRNLVNSSMLRTIYFAIFESHLNSPLFKKNVYLRTRSKKFCQMYFLQSTEMNCQLSDF